MFERSGEKLQNIATVTFVVIIIFSIAIAIGGWITDQFFLGLFAALALAGTGFLSCLMLAAFGEMSQNLSIMTSTLTDISQKLAVRQDIEQIRHNPVSSHGSSPASNNAASESLPEITWDRTMPNLGKLMNYRVYMPKGYPTVICPWCKTEQNSGVKRCAECDAEFTYVDP